MRFQPERCRGSLFSLFLDPGSLGFGFLVPSFPPYPFVAYCLDRGPGLCYQQKRTEMRVTDVAKRFGVNAETSKKCFVRRPSYSSPGVSSHLEQVSLGKGSTSHRG